MAVRKGEKMSSGRWTRNIGKGEGAKGEGQGDPTTHFAIPFPQTQKKFKYCTINFLQEQYPTGGASDAKLTVLFYSCP